MHVSEYAVNFFKLITGPLASSYFSGVQYYMVDEAQDLDVVQYKTLMQHHLAGVKVCVVGDPA